MKQHEITFPIIALIAGTRVALGVGLGFLMADWIAGERRKGAGWALVAVGALTSIPLLAEVLGGGGTPSEACHRPHAGEPQRVDAAAQ